MNKKICMLMNRFYPIIGGSEAQAQQLSERLISRGVRVFILTRRISAELEKFEYVGRIPVYRVGLRGIGRFSEYSMVFATWRFLSRRIPDFDILFSRSPTALSNLLAIPFVKRFEKKVVIRPAGSGDIVRLRNSKFSSLKCKWFKMADAFIAINSEIVKELSSLGVPKSRVCFISNGVDTGRFAPPTSNGKALKKRKLSLPENTIISFSGRLVWHKGLDVLLRAWEDVLREFPQEAHLIFLGSGSLQKDSCEQELRNFVQNHNLSSSVSFQGNVSNIEEYLQASDIYVFPSRKEGSPNALLEAMASGLPTIATRIGGVGDILKDKFNGILVDVDKPRQISEAIIFLMRNKEYAVRLGMNARTFVEKNCSLDIITERYIKFFDML